MKVIILICLFLILLVWFAVDAMLYKDVYTDVSEMVRLIDTKNYSALSEIFQTNGALVNARISFSGQRVLNYCIEKGDYKAAELLLKNGADPNKEGYADRSALHVAVENSKEDFVKLLCANGADIEAKAYRHQSSPLEVAAMRGDKDMCEVLIKEGADVNSCNDLLETPLIRATDEGQSKIVEVLLQNGANPWFKDNRGRTAFDFAKKNNNKKIMDILSKAEASW